MNNDTFSALAQFLTKCRKVIGAVDSAKFASEESYRLLTYIKVSESADESLIEMADLLRQKLEADSVRPKHLRDEIPDMGKFEYK